MLNRFEIKICTYHKKDINIEVSIKKSINNYDNNYLPHNK